MTAAGFHLECEPVADIQNATASDIERVFAADDGRSEHILLTRADGSFLHAAGEGDGPYLLIYHEEPANRHYQAHAEFSRDAAKAAMLDFLSGRCTWWDGNDWTEVKHGMPLSLFAGLACLLLGLILGVLAYVFW